jgi:hypothetical protein
MNTLTVPEALPAPTNALAMPEALPSACLHELMAPDNSRVNSKGIQTAEGEEGEDEKGDNNSGDGNEVERDSVVLR